MSRECENDDYLKRRGSKRAGGAWLLVASIFFCSWLPAAGLADEFARTHSAEIQQMVAASVRIETSFDTILKEFARKVRLASDPHSPSVRAEGSLNHECYDFVHAKFYARYKSLMDGINTYPFTSSVAIRKNRSDVSVLRDPRKIVVETKSIISGLEFQKDFHPPLEEYVVQYSARPDLEDKCAHYLDVTGMRN
jgi:hypothetical protein